MTVLLMSDTGTRAALRNPEIAGRLRVGRGQYSVVFAKGDNEVLRMTTDPLNYYMHCDGCGLALEGEHFARVTADFGEIGWQHTHDIPIYLFGTERLVKPAPGTPEKKLCSLLVKVTTEHTRNIRNGSRPVTQSAEVRALEKIAADQRLPESLRGALGELASWSANYEHVAIDIHAANIMVRPETGAIVLNDPVHDYSLHWKRNERLRRMGSAA